MNRLRRFFLRWRISTGLCLGIISALLTGAAGYFGWLNGLERTALDLLFQARGERMPDKRITLLVADDASVSKIGQWPIPRHVYAKVIRQLDKAGARTIAFDILFSVPSYSNTSDDVELEQACRESKRVIQAAVFHVPSTYNPELPASLTSDKSAPPQRFAVQDRGVSARKATWVSSALKSLQQSAPAIGHVNVYPELDGALRRIPLVRYRNNVYPSLALATVSHYLGVRPREIEAQSDSIILNPPHDKTRVIPVDEHGETWVNWVGGNDTFPTYNFNQLFSGEIPEVALKDRIVLVGITAAGAYEYRSTPFSPVQPAIELQANAINDVLSDKPLYEASDLTRNLLLVFFTITVGYFVSPRRALGGILWMISLDVIMWQVAVWALGNRDYYLPVGTPILAGLICYSAATALNYRREWEANWSVDASVTALARGGALMASGHDRASLLSVIRQTAREVLDAREVVLVLKSASGEVLEADDSLNIVRSYSNDFSRYPSLLPLTDALLKIDKTVLWSPKTLSQSVSPQKVVKPRKRGRKVELVPSSTELAQLAEPELNQALRNANLEITNAHRRMGIDPRHAFDTVVAAPLPVGLRKLEDTLESKPKFGGMLLAAGRRSGGNFTQRDLLLMEALAEQAALALDNLEYYEVLRSRVELANRNLRHAYHALSDERAKLATAIESSESALIICDESHKAVFVSGNTRQILGRATPKLGQSVPDVMYAYGLTDFTRLFNQVREQNGSALSKVVGETTLFKERASQQTTIQSTLIGQLTVLSQELDSSPGALFVITDVTAQRELERMKDDFVSYVAHELMSPLTTINGYAYLLKSNHLKLIEKQRDEILSDIEYQCNRLDRLVSDLLDVSRMENESDVQISLKEIDLVTLCRQVMQSQSNAIVDSDYLRLDMKCDYESILAIVDPDRIEQILINLLSNALKYSPEGGVITLSLTRRTTDASDAAIISVSDTGMGMTPEQQSRLFEKYYRTPDAQAKGIKGTGLGLYLTKRLVEAHGGTIQVSSAVGEETTFSVTIPLDESELFAYSEEDQDYLGLN